MSRAGYRLRARHLARCAAALFLDALLIAYVFWCVSFLQAHALGGGFLAARPQWVLLAPLLAVFWQVGGASLGQRAYRLGFVGIDGVRVTVRRRLAWGVSCGALVVALLGAFWAHPALGFGAATLSLLLTVLRQRPGIWRWTGVRLAERREEETGPIRAWYTRPGVWAVLVLLCLTFAVGFVLTDVSLSALVDNAARTKPIVARLTNPDWSIVGRVLDKLVETVFLAFMASALSLPFAFVLSFFGARNLTRGSLLGRLGYSLARIFMNVTRSIEPLVWGIIFIVWVGVGPFAGMLALFIHSVAALGKLYSEAIESIDTGPVEAIQATGASHLQVLRFGVVPQVIPPFLSFTVYRWDINVRMATILGLIGGGGIGNLLIDYTQLGAWNKLGTVILFITLVVWLMDIVSAKARERLG